MKNRILDPTINNEVFLLPLTKRGMIIAWSYIFADAAITATRTHARGYQLLKVSVGESDEYPQVVVADQLDRIHGDQGELIRFHNVVQSRWRRLITTDTFDSACEFSKIAQAFSSLRNELHIEQLKSKVDRRKNHAVKIGKRVSDVRAGHKFAM